MNVDLIYIYIDNDDDLKMPMLQGLSYQTGDFYENGIKQMVLPPFSIFSNLPELKRILMIHDTNLLCSEG